MDALLADNIFKRIFFNEKTQILIQISLKFVLKGPINKITALVQIMAWGQAITWTNVGPVHQCIYAALGGDELMVIWYILNGHHDAMSPNMSMQ